MSILKFYNLKPLGDDELKVLDCNSRKTFNEIFQQVCIINNNIQSELNSIDNIYNTPWFSYALNDLKIEDICTSIERFRTILCCENKFIGDEHLNYIISYLAELHINLDEILNAINTKDYILLKRYNNILLELLLT